MHVAIKSEGIRSAGKNGKFEGNFSGRTYRKEKSFENNLRELRRENGC
jgi:hypothetical protein